MREMIQIGDTLEVAVFHFLTRSYATRTNVFSDSSDVKSRYSVSTPQWSTKGLLRHPPRERERRRERETAKSGLQKFPDKGYRRCNGGKFGRLLQQLII